MVDGLPIVGGQKQQAKVPAQAQQAQDPDSVALKKRKMIALKKKQLAIEMEELEMEG